MVHHSRPKPKRVIQLYPQGDHTMTTSVPENQPMDSASGAHPIVSTPLPSAQELLNQVTAQQQADSAARADAPPKASFTPSAASAQESDTSTPPSKLEIIVALSRAQNVYIKAQTAFLHDKNLKALTAAQTSYIDALTTVVHEEHLPALTAAQELHIVELTASLEKLGVL